jgi:hypothetical protein
VLARQEHNRWGSRVIVRLAEDLRSEFPDMTGFSPRNLQVHLEVDGDDFYIDLLFFHVEQLATS